MIHFLACARLYASPVSWAARAAKCHKGHSLPIRFKFLDSIPPSTSDQLVCMYVSIGKLNTEDLSPASAFTSCVTSASHLTPWFP